MKCNNKKISTTTPSMESMDFLSTLLSSISIDNSSLFVEADTPATDPIYHATISFKADLNDAFKTVRMPARHADPVTGTTVNYDFKEDEDGPLLRSLFETKLPEWLLAAPGKVAVHDGTYIDQVKYSLKHLFDNIGLDSDAGILPIGPSLNTGIVRLKQSVCEDFAINPDTAKQTLGGQTFRSDQLLQLCEASARDAGRYGTSGVYDATNGSPYHHLKLDAGDSWTVRVQVSARGAGAAASSNTQLWALNIQQLPPVTPAEV